jgi:hypothetical protein
MGFGHRVYRVRDPRADALKAAVARLPGTSGRIAFADHIEKTVLGRLAKKYPNRTLETNVEFSTALLLEALAIPREAFTATFASLPHPPSLSSRKARRASPGPRCDLWQLVNWVPDKRFAFSGMTRGERSEFV